jgi:hypothetical protein
MRGARSETMQLTSPGIFGLIYTEKVQAADYNNGTDEKAFANVFSLSPRAFMNLGTISVQFLDCAGPTRCRGAVDLRGKDDSLSQFYGKS